MKKKPVDFQEERNFGQVISGTFLFLRQNIRSLIKPILYYSGPVILLTGLVVGLFQSFIVRFQSDITNYSIDPYSYGAGNPLERVFSQLGDFLMYYCVLLFLGIISYTILIGVLYSYITLYVEKGKDNFSVEEVWAGTKKNFFRIVGTNLLIGLIVGVGICFCCVPGVYFFNSLILVVIIIVHEKLAFGDAFRRSFELVRIQWWWTLLIVLVVNGIAGVLSSAVSIPEQVLSMVNSFMTLSGKENEILNISAIVLTTFATFVTYLLNIIPFTAYAFQYFSLVEKKESPGLMKKVEDIGKSTLE